MQIVEMLFQWLAERKKLIAQITDHRQRIWQLEQHGPTPLTLDQLTFKPEQLSRFKSLSKDQRQDLHDACEHIILTRYKEEDRKAALALRNYFLQLTLGPANRCDFDSTPLERSFERTQKYFPKKA